MMTRKRLVLSSPRARKLLWAAVTGDRNIVLVGDIASRSTPSVPALRRFMGSPRHRVIVEVVPAPRPATRTRRWQP